MTFNCNYLTRLSINLSLKHYQLNRLIATSVIKYPTLCSKSPQINQEKLQKPNDLLVNNEGYYTIYRFTYITLARLICRLKVYQTLFTTVLAPYIGYGYINGQISLELASYIGGATSFAILVLVGFGEFFRRIIGIVYYHPDKEIVRISHLSFWGNRSEQYIPLDEFLHISETSESLNDVYWKIQFTNSQRRQMFISSKFGKVLHIDYFAKIFGQEVYKYYADSSKKQDTTI